MTAWPLSNAPSTHQRRVEILDAMTHDMIWRQSRLHIILTQRAPRPSAQPALSTMRADLIQLEKRGWVRRVDKGLWIRTNVTPAEMDRESLERWLDEV